ncbi:hypothetical protein CLHOM_02550 [Clostridium homopropionicum DSM 5847]|uniref:Uncharacterized protein n=1 Tax=Clostridium homopropionicum DSM 5847 TaxID=1121318 RepID=A0A0L6ZEX7_9CLOT|nr:hypothetical protein [Clostridium homopropionicum]KOA21328.1 hypothetical protein CLHOM_02550 [Clostridium homopropionicum DSM 5847]SFG95891.1 hypothetical protein SAMN04488501_12719 [Clostridium homopropionicum]
MLFYKSNNTLQVGMSMSAVFDNARANTPEPMPQLESCNKKIYVYQNEMKFIDIKSERENLSAFGLITCASVVFASVGNEDPAIVCVYHAPSGVLSNNIIQDAVTGLGNPNLNNLYVIYAINNKKDENYIAEAGKLITFGIPNDNIVFIEQINSSCFGINSHGQVGVFG